MILYRLQGGPCSGAALVQLARKYTARISDLRKKGYKITAYRHHDDWWYRLED
jgi:hypothetical protein